NTRWRTPPEGQWKLNFDGASRGNPGPSGAGCIIRDDRGLLIHAGSFPLQVGTSNSAEAQALLEGVKMA
ncbi:hypothetical protein KI387_021179, partial [Taxus chinensis]